MEKDDIKEIIEAAVYAAYDAGIKGMDEKLQEAINLGVTIGTKIGIEIGAVKGAEAGAAAAVKAVEKERKKIKKQQYDSRLYNTKLLLRHYRTLNEHYHNAVYDADRAEGDETFAEIMQNLNVSAESEEVYIESIKQSCVRTKVIMAHVNKMLGIYKIMCMQSARAEDARHWRALEAVYISKQAATVAEVAMQENINKRTVYKDIDICIADLTALFFGIDGVKRQ